MRTRLAALAMVGLLPGCGGGIGGGGLPTSNATYGFGGLSGADLGPANARLPAGASMHFSVQITNPRLAAINFILAPVRETGDAEFLGFACVPSNACAIERIGRNRSGNRNAVLRLEGATEVTTRIGALTPGEMSLVIGAYERPCRGTPPDECGGPYAFDMVWFRVDP
jgi:hypothetical protein